MPQNKNAHDLKIKLKKNKSWHTNTLLIGRSATLIGLMTNQEGLDVVCLNCISSWWWEASSVLSLAPFNAPDVRWHMASQNNVWPNKSGCMTMEDHFSCTETLLTPKLMGPVEFIFCSIQHHVIDNVCNHSPQSRKTEEETNLSYLSLYLLGYQK